jgi:hypothetical protein
MAATVLPNQANGNPKICGIEATDETLSGRGGLVLFTKYLASLAVVEILAERFGGQRRNKKGARVAEIFKQVLCFFFDGSSFHLNRFDVLAREAGYAGVIESRLNELVSSHAVKRFFKSFYPICGAAFRVVLRRLFLWRLKLEQPEVIELTVDTEVLDNDDALGRGGVSPTYQKVKGFQPLHVIWNGRIVDAVFRGGKKNGNYGDVVAETVRGLVKLIREGYRADVPIVVRLDAGFFDQDNFRVFDELEVGFICTGKMYEDVKAAVKAIPAKKWAEYENERQRWQYAEWMYGAESWKGRQYRAIYTRPVYEESGQVALEFARPDNVIVTNLGIKLEVVKGCSAAEARRLTSAEAIISSHHARGGDELPHRGLKDFGTEKLPFKRFGANCAFYYCMVIAFFLFECFKRDVVAETLPELATSYASTLRRTVIDFAAKIIRRGRQLVLKIARATMETLRFDALWRQAQQSPPIPI